MPKSFSKTSLLSLLTLASLSFISSSLEAVECCWPSTCNRFYIGAFGGGLYTRPANMSQRGTVFLNEPEGGALAVNAYGVTNSPSSLFGGAQMGYEWSKYPLNMGFSESRITSAAELEGYWYSHTTTASLFNTTDRGREQHFENSFQMNAGVYLVNAVFSLHHSSLKALSPYMGGGIGAARLSLTSATSLQTSPAEPGINHFNAGQSDSSWAFAAQIKAGLRYNIYDSFHIFGEYRYVFLDYSNYIFGSTVNPLHAATSPWNVQVQNMRYNAFVFGIQYDL